MHMRDQHQITRGFRYQYRINWKTGREAGLYLYRTCDIKINYAVCGLMRDRELPPRAAHETDDNGAVIRQLASAPDERHQLLNRLISLWEDVNKFH